MAYIAPNTYVKLYKGVDIDPDYNHTIRFDNAQQQKEWFNNKYGGTQIEFNGQSYQRFEKGSLKLQTPIEPVLQCNYMVFGNSSFENKQFYAFVTSVEYSSNNVTIIEYEIDVMQTWMFDYTIDDVFVEREHSATDNIGENILPEPVGVSGEMIVQTKTEIKFKYFAGGLMTSKKLPDKVRAMQVWGVPSPLDGYWKIETKEINGALCGVPTTVFLVMGLCIDTKDIRSKFGNPNMTKQNFCNTYQLQDYDAYQELDDIISPDNKLLTLSSLIANICDGKIDGFDEGHIIGAFTYPADVTRADNLARGFNKTGNTNISISEDYEISVPNYISDGDKWSIQPYYPKNKKLWSEPYSQICISNLNGTVTNYGVQNFKNKNYPSFRWVSNACRGCDVMLYPINHREINDDYDYAINNQDFPEPLYSGDSFNMWWNRNKNSVILSAISSAVSGLSLNYTHKPQYTTQYQRMGKTVTRTNREVDKYNADVRMGSLGGVLNAIGTGLDLKNTPPNVYGNNAGKDIFIGLNECGFKIYFMTIKPEIAKTVDDFFTMFGYSANVIKQPNFLNSDFRRPSYNYIKTVNMHLNNQMLPAGAIDKICSIYDKGITFWERNITVGNYNAQNQP